MKQSLFQYAVIVHQYVINDKQVREYTESKMVIEPKTVLAVSDNDLKFSIIREIPDEYAKKPEDLDIVIRPF